MNIVLSASSPFHKRRASIPTFLAYFAGCTFTLASSATNLTYAIGRADTLPPQIIWGSVAVAASVALALAPSAIVASLGSRKFGAASLALVAALLFGAYSVTAALGSATGGRLVAETEASDMAARRKSAAATIEKAEVELAKIGDVRTVPVVDAEISQVYSRTPGLDDCVPKPNWTPSKQHREACKAIAVLNVEKASAQRKADLEATIIEARDDLASLKPSKTVANADAVALQGFAVALGIKVDTDTLNRLLVVLAVLVIELGGGLAFAVGQGLAQSVPDRATVHRQTVQNARGTSLEAPQTARCGVDGQSVPPLSQPTALAVSSFATDARQSAVPVLTSGTSSPEAAILSIVQNRGGAVIGTQRSMAEQFGLSRSVVNRTLHDLATAGRITLATSARGTVVTLASAH